MIDLSAAFDTVDIPIVLQILQEDFGIKGTPLNWVKSYLTERTMKVIVDNASSNTEQLQFGVPQGSCAGPVIFTMYIAVLNKVVQKYPAELYGYADDHKIAFRIQAGNAQNETNVLQQLNYCPNDTILWVTNVKLKLDN